MTPEKDDPAENTFHALKAALGKAVRPFLTKLGFEPFKSKSVFPERYVRHRDNVIDVIEFQFDKYGRPAFRVNFRPIDDPDDLAIVERNDEELWRWGAGFAANARTGGRSRYQLTLMERLFDKKKGIERLSLMVRERLQDMDAFLRGGEPSIYLSELPAWNNAKLASVGRKPPKRRIARSV